MGNKIRNSYIRNVIDRRLPKIRNEAGPELGTKLVCQKSQPFSSAAVKTTVLRMNDIVLTVGSVSSPLLPKNYDQIHTA